MGQLANRRNPYIAGTPLREEQGFFGRQDVLDWVMRELRNPGTNVLVLHGQRRIGKTTLLLQIRRMLPINDFWPIYFDLQDQTSRLLSTVLADLADTISEHINLELNLAELFNDRGRFFQRTFLPSLYQALGDNCRPVFLMDEFDVLDQAVEAGLPKTAAAKTLFPFLRRVMTEDPRPAFVFAAGRRTEDMAFDFLATFKASLKKEIWVLDQESAESLVRQADADDTLRFTESAVERILNLTCCHPYLTQLLCQRIWERAYQYGPTQIPLIDTPEVEAAIPNALETGENALVWLWNGLTPAEKIYTAAMAEAADTEGKTISEDTVMQILSTHAVRLRRREVEIAPRDLVKRRVLEEVEKREYRLAVELFRRWVRKNTPLRDVKDELDRIEPQADLLFKLGRQSFYNEQWEEAIGFFQQALERNPHHFQARLFLGEAQLNLKQTDEAVSTLKRAYELDKDEARLSLARAMVAQARAREQAGNEQGALDVCEQVLVISPKERQAHKIRTTIWIRRRDVALEQNELDVALDAHQQMSDEPDDTVVDFLQHVLKVDSQHIRAQILLGEALLALGHNDEAVTELERAYTLDQAEGQLPLARALVIRAQTREKAGDEDSALAACERALQVFPDEQQAQEIRNGIWIRRGNAAIEQGDMDRALNAYQQAGAGKWEDAVPWIRRVLEGEPDLLYTRLHLGQVLLELGWIDEAAAELERAYELNQDEACLPLVHVLLTHAKEKLEIGDEDSAMVACERVLQISSNEQQAQEILTTIWTHRRDASLERDELNAALDAHQRAGIKPGDEAVEFIRRVLQKAPRHFRAQFLLGQMLLELDRVDEAVVELERAYELDPDAGRNLLIQASMILAREQEAAGVEEKALATCERVLKISSDIQEAQEMRTAIWVRRGNAAFDQDDLDIALAAYLFAGDESRIKAVEKAKRHRDYETLEREAIAYEQTKQWPRAIEIYERLLAETDDEELQDKWQVALTRAKAELSRVKLGDWQTGHTVDGRYEITEQLATTVRSEIYLAKELQPPHHTVVVKRLKPGAVGEADALKRFEREIVVLRQIRHDSVLFLYDSKAVGSNRYIVTEFADKGTLWEYLKAWPNHKLRPIEAVDIALSACKGLEAAHRQGIIHRDIKPGNIFLFTQQDGSITAKLADFSVAHVLRTESGVPPLTKIGTFVGTYLYASPEQLKAAEMVDSRSDLYSWAIVFFEMLTGEFPTDSLKDPTNFQPTAEEFPESFFIERGIPYKLVPVLQKSLYYDQERRYQSVAEVRGILETIKSQLITDIEYYLSVGEEHVQSKDWHAANTEFEQGLALCDWYGTPSRWPDAIERLASKLRVGHLCARGMVYVNERRWQEAIQDLESLRALAPEYMGMDIATELMQAQAEQQQEEKRRLLDRYIEQEDWVKISQVATDITTTTTGRRVADDESLNKIQEIALYARGKSLLEEDELENAYKHFYRLYERDPNYKDVAELCATLAFQIGIRKDDQEYQVEWLAKAVEIAPHHREGQTQQQLDRVRHRWARELLFEGDRFAARIQLERISREYTLWAEVYQTLCNVYFQLLQEEKYTNTEWSHFDAEAEARYRLGMEQWGKGNLQGAAEQLAQIHPETDEFDNVQPVLVKIYAALAQQAVQNGHWQSVIEWQSKALTLFQALEGSPPPSEDYQILINAYYWLIREGNYVRTEQSNLNAEAAAHYRLGMERWSQKDLQGAIAHLDQVQPTAPDYDGARATLINAYVALGQQATQDEQPDDATKWWNQALTLSLGLEGTPQWSEVYQPLTDAYYGLLQRGTYTRTDQSNLDVEAEARYRLGMERWNQGDLRGAVEQLEHISSTMARFDDARADMVKIYVAMGRRERQNRRWNEAILWWDKAQALSQDLEKMLQWRIREAQVGVWADEHRSATLISVFLAILGIGIVTLQLWPIIPSSAPTTMPTTSSPTLTTTVTPAPARPTAAPVSPTSTPAVDLSLPENKAEFNPGERITFCWTGPDPDNGGYYEVWVDGNSIGTAQFDSGSQQWEVIWEADQAGVYTWQVVLMAADQPIPQWSGPGQSLVVANESTLIITPQSPIVIALVEPENEAEFNTDEQVAFRWTGPDPDTRGYYEVRVDGISIGTAQLNPDSQQWEMIWDGSDQEGMHTWQLVLVAAGEHTAWWSGPERNLVVVEPPIATRTPTMNVVLIGPENGAKFDPNQRVDFYWTGPEPEQGGYYEVRVDGTITGAAAWFNTDLQRWQSTWQARGEGRHTWRVVLMATDQCTVQWLGPEQNLQVVPGPGVGPSPAGSPTPPPPPPLLP